MKRCTGHTTKMLSEAMTRFLKGGKIIIVCCNERYARDLFDKTHSSLVCLLGSGVIAKQHNKQIELTTKDHTGVLIFEGYDRNNDPSRYMGLHGWSTMFDNSVWQR